MKTAFNPQTGDWEIAWPGRLARHDLVYLSPPEDPTQGIPLGNGEVGVLAWCEGSQLILVINKCDLWDKVVQPEGLHNWSPAQEENSTTQRHAGRLILDFKLPVFDLFYLADFEARLSLADATLHLRASGPLGSIQLRAFVAHDTGALCIDAKCELAERTPISVRVERYGSRTFGHWYAQVRRDPTVGLAGTNTAIEGNDLYVTHRLTTGTFALGCRVQASEAPIHAEREHAHSARLDMGDGGPLHFTLTAVVASPVETEPVARARALLDIAQQRGVANLYQQHAAAWKAFWLRSLMASGDDYLDNLWHLTLYYANASQRGYPPGRFIFGLWGWNRDVQHWTFYFHWNQQQVYWPLNAAGHHDLLASYLEYRFDSLPHARRDARERLGADGAFVSDVADALGRNSLGECENHTPVAQIALDFWRQYRYTGDAVFLRTRALPYLLAAASFFESLFEREADGLYHAREGTGYEGWIRLHDAITELACGRALFAATLQALREAGEQHPRAAHWQELLDHLAPLPTLEPEGCFQERDGTLVLARGQFAGQTATGTRTLAAGWGLAEGRMLASKVPVDTVEQPFPDAYTVLHRLESNETLYSAIREDMRGYDGIFPFVEYSAVYPSGLVGLGQRDSELYALAANTARLYAPDCMGWDPLPIVLARLGLRAELAEILRHWPARWQFQCNGFGHYGPRDIQKAEAALRFRTNRVRDADAPNDESRRFPFPMWPFRHMGLESMSVLSCALNEALLQSHDGVVRVAPAAFAPGQARFSLHAQGGYIVSAELQDGRPLWLAVRSLRGGECVVENPWETAHSSCNGTSQGSTVERQLRLACQPGDLWLLAPQAEDLDDWQVEPVSYAPNADAKRCPDDWAQLGLPRMF